MSDLTALAGDIQLLTEVLDGAGVGVEAPLSSLISRAQIAVPSFLGLSLRLLRTDGPTLRLATLPNHPDPGSIGTSLRFTMSPDPEATGAGLSTIELSLYAAKPGALTDLAADLAWLTGRPSAEFRVDEDPLLPAEDDSVSLASWSNLNQARGVLMSRGLTAEESDNELDARATSAGVDRHHAAAELLARLASGSAEGD